MKLWSKRCGAGQSCAAATEPPVKEEVSMDERTRSLFEAALTLPEGQRLLLAERLLENLPGDSGEHPDDESFAAELDRRYDEFQRDPTVAVPWSDVLHEE